MTKKNTRRNRNFLSKNFTRKSDDLKQIKIKKQSGGFYLESSAIILGMKYLFNREDIKGQWKTGVRPSKTNKKDDSHSNNNMSVTNTTNVTTSDIKICFEKNINNIQESIKRVMKLFFTKVIKTNRTEFRQLIKQRLTAEIVDGGASLSWKDVIPSEQYKKILDAITGVPDNELDEWEDGITYYTPQSNAYEWGGDSLNNIGKQNLISDITNKILQIFISKTDIDVIYLADGQRDCDDNPGTDQNFFICNREGRQNHFDLIYHPVDVDDSDIRFNIPDSGYCLYAALSLLYIIKKLNITTAEGFTAHLDDDMYAPYTTVPIAP